MSDGLDQGMTVTEIASMDQPIDVFPHTTTAFIGRALRGPLNTPIHLQNFAEFRRRFGGVWRLSSLGPAVQQFFEHGGKQLYVVRVANNARGAMICLLADHGVLTLHALEPGATESIRAAVDYDRIDAEDTDSFNLTIQRVAPISGLVIDQEIYRRLTCRAEDRRFIADVLLDSTLVQVHLPPPPGRPMATIGPGSNQTSEYVGHAQRGSDGAELTDYDLIGSATANTGLFALNELEQFDLLYLPPPGKEHDLGPAVVLAAELYCRKRGAMLLLDPPAEWRSVTDALIGVRNAGYSSANIASYFPRMISRDDEDPLPRAVGGALAGLLSKLDEQQGPWHDLDQPGFGFSRKLTPAIQFTMEEGAMLVREGLNAIAGQTAGRAAFCGSVTLGCGSQMDKKFASLTVRRLCLTVTNTIDRATRWAIFEADASRAAERIQAQVHAYMTWLADQGAFEVETYSVQCDATLQQGLVDPQRGMTILLTFHPLGCDQSVSLALHQSAAGCRVATTAFAPVPQGQDVFFIP